MTGTKRMSGAMAVAASALAVSFLGGCKSGVHIGGPSIEGTYRLVARELPDGTRLEPPAVDGMLTFTDTHRHICVFAVDPAGKRFTLTGMSQYELVNDRYWEQNIFYFTNNEQTGAGATYDTARPGGSSDVTIGKDGAISFKLPLFNEPYVVFTRRGLTATREGEFVDHWVRVD